MNFFHVTAAKNAADIDDRGFEDARDSYLTDSEHQGVWISDRPLDGNDMGTVIDNPAVFEIEIEESLLQDYEWVEEGKTYREWLVPAAVLNTGRRRLLPDTESRS